MIVEFIGCSGAGKTTLATELIARQGLRRPVVKAVDLVMDRTALRRVKDPMAVNFAADVISFPSFVRALGRDGPFVRFAFDRLRRHAPSAFAKYNYMVNIVRRVGVHEMSRRAARTRTVLADEGVVLSAYHLFVYSGAPVDPGDLDRFAELVPLPDRVVYVRAPHDLLVERALRRSDPRRELVGRSRTEVSEGLARAVGMFDALVETPAIKERLVTIDIQDDSIESRDAAVRELSSMIDASPHRQPRLIAFVGSEASGKSTVLDTVGTWLAERGYVRRIHVGKPPSTALTFVPHVLLPAFRSLFPQQRLLKVEADRREDRGRGSTDPPLFAMRAVMLAYERRALIVGALRRSPPGTIVLADRYPSTTPGAPDGPQLNASGERQGRSLISRILSRAEARLYAGIPRPDLVFHLSAPLDVTLARNAAREKREPERYVRFRHALSEELRFEGSVVHRIDTDRDLDGVIIDVKTTIADALTPPYPEGP
jgi:thymidylate kinase